MTEYAFQNEEALMLKAFAVNANAIRGIPQRVTSCLRPSQTDILHLRVNQPVFEAVGHSWLMTRRDYAIQEIPSVS